MQHKIQIILFVTSLLLSVNNLYGQETENLSAASCPQEIMEVHISQGSIFTGEIMWFKVYCTSPLFPKEELSSLAFVELVSNENTTVLRKKILLKRGEGSGELEIPDNLPTGLYYMLAYTNWMKNFGETSFARKELIIVNPFQPFNKAQEYSDSIKAKEITTFPDNSQESLKITPDKDKYSTRQQIAIKVEVNNTTGKTISDFSVSVYRKEPAMIYNRGKRNNQSLKKLPEKITYLPDYKGIRLSGTLSDGSDKIIPAASITESAIGGGTDIVRSLTDRRGQFNFLLKPREGEQEVVLTKPGEGNKISLEETFWNGFRNVPDNRALSFNNEAISYLKGKFNHFQFQLRFKKQNFLKKASEKITRDSTVFYSKPYQLIELKDYVTLDSLREYFYELVPSVKFSRKEGGLDITVRDSVNHSFYEDKPGVFLDGVYYDNYAQLVSIPVRSVDRIAVLPNLYYYKDFTFGGIIDIHTRKSDFNSVKPLPNMSRIIYPLADASEWNFSSPDYSMQASSDRTPDFRYLLYWEPNARTESTGASKVKFYTGDVKGTFVVKIVALSEDGLILQAEKEIVVE